MVRNALTALSRSEANLGSKSGLLPNVVLSMSLAMAVWVTKELSPSTGVCVGPRTGSECLLLPDPFRLVVLGDFCVPDDMVDALDAWSIVGKTVCGCDCLDKWQCPAELDVN